VKMFDASKTRMIGLPYGKKNYDDMLSRFHAIPACHEQTDRRTDGRTDGQSCYLSISRVRRGYLATANARKSYSSRSYPGLLEFTVLPNPYSWLGGIAVRF